MPPEDEKPSLLDAVTEGIAEATPEPPKPAEPVGDEPKADEPKADEPKGDEPKADEPKGDEPKGDEPKADEPKADEPKEGEPKEGEPKEGEPKPKDERPKDEKPLDALNDPIPTGVAERTRERITTLVEMVKTGQRELQERNDFIDTIVDTGATPDEVGAMIGYLRLIHSPNLEDKRAAFKVIMTEMRGLAPLIGETLPGTDPLEGHQDLLDAVGANSITRQHAEEIARSRNREKATMTADERRTQESRAAAELQQATATARAELNAIGATLAQTDPLYKAKSDLLIPALKPVFARLHPSQWKAAFEQAYRDMKVAPAPAPAGGAAPGAGGNGASSPTPMRPNKQPAGQSQRQPSSLAEAISAGITEAGAR
jgi:hypothetical protein